RDLAVSTSDVARNPARRLDAQRIRHQRHDHHDGRPDCCGWMFAGGHFKRRLSSSSSKYSTRGHRMWPILDCGFGVGFGDPYHVTALLSVTLLEMTHNAKMGR